MPAPRSSTLLVLFAVATTLGGSAVATADAAPAPSRFYKNCPTVTKRLYPKPPNLVSSFCKGGSYYERIKVADASSMASPDGTVTITPVSTSVITVKRGPAKAKPAAPAPAVA